MKPLTPEQVDKNYMAIAISLSERGRGRTGSNPNVGAILVKDGHIVGRGWTADGGRPHAEAGALAQAGGDARGATAYVTLEPCAHKSERGPSCADSLIEAGISRIVIALLDPDPRTTGIGAGRMKAAGISVSTGEGADNAWRVMAGFLTRFTKARPFVTLKLATSLDGCIAMGNGESKWITGDAARAHTHLERSKHDAIMVGAGTVRADTPQLNVRLEGLEPYAPQPIMLGKSTPPEGWLSCAAPEKIEALAGLNWLFVEGGAVTASSFLKAGLVDRLLLYRAPILIGGGKPALADIGLTALDQAHGQWKLFDARQLGKDRLEVYDAVKHDS